ncbi:hypothetical protein G3580_08445 [Nitrogeniibacter mangrovi]|uniref:Uncharacterized protein n=1 Tax=Nitrogeniibacter mangrovi TaxID=2016596 RepID=A0A6C1B3U8_9RHOO|nr:hypothetical protein [Nitrogeniibacter mangrovi]QID17669.1 hypothetical protein G3580_08445 [Nitrogeniibacter mangrovi]
MNISTVTAAISPAATTPMRSAATEKTESREPDGDRDDTTVQSRSSTQPTPNLLGQPVGTIINTQA